MANIHNAKDLKIAAIFIGIEDTPHKKPFLERYFSDAYIHIDMAVLGSRGREQTMLRQCYRHGESYVTDCPNLTFNKRKRYIDSAKQNGYRVIGYYFPIDELIEKQSKQPIPNKMLLRSYMKMRERLDIPSYSEGFDEIYTVSFRSGDFETEKLNKDTSI